MAPRRVLESGDIARSVSRIAHEIVERNQGASDLVLMGIQTRGVPLAARLAGHIKEIEGVVVPHGSLDITLHRDDLSRRGPLPLGETSFPCDVNGRVVVLVDDVLYTGRTVRAALEEVVEVGRPRAVRLAVLIDRGHRELPIRADHVGKNLPTSRKEDVRVRLAEVDGTDAVDVIPCPARGAGPSDLGWEQ
ncbi:MAG: bifunctional pyr operon transcriptional regulator/uracil phosphoribosyltransferase PyrR [Nitriliruptorales bacterium]